MIKANNVPFFLRSELISTEIKEIIVSPNSELKFRKKAKRCDGCGYGRNELTGEWIHLSSMNDVER